LPNTGIRVPLWKAQTNGQANGKLSKDQLSKYTLDLHNLLSPTTTSYLHEEKAYFSVYGKQRGFFSGKICVILLPQACVCVRVHMCVSVWRMVMFKLLESHSNNLSPISSKKHFRNACYRFQEPQVQVVQTMVVNQLCLSNPLTSSETYDIGAVS